MRAGTTGARTSRARRLRSAAELRSVPVVRRAWAVVNCLPKLVSGKGFVCCIRKHPNHLRRRADLCGRSRPSAPPPKCKAAPHSQRGHSWSLLSPGAAPVAAQGTMADDQENAGPQAEQEQPRVPVLGVKRRPAFRAPAFVAKKPALDTGAGPKPAAPAAAHPAAVAAAKPALAKPALGKVAGPAKMAGPAKAEEAQGEARYFTVRLGTAEQVLLDPWPVLPPLQHPPTNPLLPSPSLHQGALLQVPTRKEASQEQVVCRRHPAGGGGHQESGACWVLGHWWVLPVGWLWLRGVLGAGSWMAWHRTMLT